jgi:predicted GNAT family N-acyltransferase
MIEIVRGDHISLLFVDRRCEGIGKTLVAMAVDECLRIKPELKSITVNSSPFAVPAYEKMGFRAVGPFREVNGIIFIPMERPVD